MRCWAQTLPRRPIAGRFTDQSPPAGQGHVLRSHRQRGAIVGRGAATSPKGQKFRDSRLSRECSSRKSRSSLVSGGPSISGNSEIISWRAPGPGGAPGSAHARRPGAVGGAGGVPAGRAGPAGGGAPGGGRPGARHRLHRVPRGGGPPGGVRGRPRRRHLRLLRGCGHVPDGCGPLLPPVRVPGWICWFARVESWRAAPPTPLTGYVKNSCRKSCGACG